MEPATAPADDAEKAAGRPGRSWPLRAADACIYGNYFLGLCAVAQVIETAALLRLPQGNAWLLNFAFAGTVLFYTYPYVRRGPGVDGNLRSQWYRRHFGFVCSSQIFLTLWLMVSAAAFYGTYHLAINKMELAEWGLLAVFPLVSAFYYGGRFLSYGFNLRRVGWLKPFIIGFAWAGLTLVYPILFSRIQYGHHLALTWFPFMLFLKSFMFVSMLAILFDIKDRAVDVESGLDTWVVRFGLRRTLFSVTLPLTVLGVLTFLTYATARGFSIPRMALVLIPFVLLMLAIISLRKPRSLLYYLVVIDGLMLAKGLFGIAAAAF